MPIFKELPRRKLIFAISLLSFALVLGGAFWAYFSLRGATSPLILHFDDLAGITQIGGAWSLLAVGSIAVIAVLINFILALEFERRDAVMGKLLAAGALFLALLLFLGFASIINVN